MYGKLYVLVNLLTTGAFSDCDPRDADRKIGTVGFERGMDGELLLISSFLRESMDSSLQSHLRSSTRTWASDFGAFDVCRV